MKKKNYRRKRNLTQKRLQKITDIIYGPSYLESVVKVVESARLAETALKQFRHGLTNWREEILGNPFLHLSRGFQKELLYNIPAPAGTLKINDGFSCLLVTTLLPE